MSRPIWAEVSGTSTAQVTIAAPGQGKRLHLMELSVKSTAAYTLTVQSPANTNVFRHVLAATEGYEKSWGSEHGVIGAEDAAMVIDVSAGDYDINYTVVTR